MKETTIGIDLLKVIFRWRKLFLIVILLSVTVSVIITSPAFMPPLYKSETIIYPPATYSTKALAEFDLRLGADKDIDEHIQMLKSGILRDSIIKKYNLLEHYSIDPNSTSKRADLHAIYDDRVKIERTRYNSISVTVYDTDPEVAAKIAADIVKTGDDVKGYIIKQNLRIAYRTVEKEYYDKIREFDAMGAEIKLFTAGEIKTDAFDALNKNTTEKLNNQLELRNAIKRAQGKSNKPLLDLLYNYEAKWNALNELQESMTIATAKLNNKINSSYIVTPAEIADRKSSPLRSVIIIVATLGSLLVALLITIAIENLSRIRETLNS